MDYARGAPGVQSPRNPLTFSLDLFCQILLRRRGLDFGRGTAGMDLALMPVEQDLGRTATLAIVSYRVSSSNFRVARRSTVLPYLCTQRRTGSEHSIIGSTSIWRRAFRFRFWRAGMSERSFSRHHPRGDGANAGESCGAVEGGSGAATAVGVGPAG